MTARVWIPIDLFLDSLEGSGRRSGRWLLALIEAHTCTGPISARMYQSLIDEVTKDVDVASLPLWPEGHETPKS